MEDSGEDYSTSSSSTAIEPSQSATTNNEGPSLRISPRNSAQKNTKSVSVARVRMPSNLRSVNGMKKHLSNLLKGRDIDYNVSVRVLIAALTLQGDYLTAVGKAAKEKKSTIPKPRIRETLCKQFHISTTTYSKIFSKYFGNKSIYVSKVLVPGEAAILPLEIREFQEQTAF